MDETKLALEVTTGIKGLFQDLIAPDIKAIIAVLSSHTELLKEHSQKLDNLVESISELKYLPKILDEHGQKLDKLAEGIHQLDLRQGEILPKLDLERRVSALEGS